MSNFVDYTGHRFGRLIALDWRRKEYGRQGLKRIYWRCRCDCGQLSEVMACNLVSGITTSCGCYGRETQHLKNARHQKYGSHLYKLWADIKQRTTNPNAPTFDRYGGRGISMHSRWSDSYEVFAADVRKEIGDHPGTGFSLDRVNNDGNYEPGNIRWATPIIQNRNKRNLVKFLYNGKQLCIAELAEISGLMYQTLYCRLMKYNWDLPKAMTTPVR